MTMACERAVADTFLREAGFTIHPAPRRQRRTAVRDDGYTVELPPACRHGVCRPTQPNNPNRTEIKK